MSLIPLFRLCDRVRIGVRGLIDAVIADELENTPVGLGNGVRVTFAGQS
jgi:hypothetical protein